MGWRFFSYKGTGEALMLYRYMLRNNDVSLAFRSVVLLFPDVRNANGNRNLCGVKWNAELP